MTRNPAKILSVSRRTDIPAFYLEWFMEHIRKGFFNIKNPYTRKTTKLDLKESPVHSIVFWSKDFGPFVRSGAGRELQAMGYNLYFNFTINSRSKILENNLPLLPERLRQLEQLAEVFGGECISWRFDPICFYRVSDQGPLENNLGDFSTIAEQAGRTGIKECVTSFCDLYAKINKRTKFLSKKGDKTVHFHDPDDDKKVRIIERMEHHLKQYGIGLFLCCEKKLFELLGESSPVSQNACIDGPKLKSLFGGDPETRRDYGQRAKLGCKCTRSVDVGSYDDHPCFHNCLFCYASPEIDRKIKKDKNQ